MKLSEADLRLYVAFFCEKLVILDQVVVQNAAAVYPAVALCLILKEQNHRRQCEKPG